MSVPYARFSQLLRVTSKKANEARKEQARLFVSTQWWIYAAVPKGEDSEFITQDKFLAMHGLGDERPEEDIKAEKERAHKEEIDRAYRNFDKATSSLSGAK